MEATPTRVSTAPARVDRVRVQVRDARVEESAHGRLPARPRVGSEPQALTRAACEGLSRACGTPYDTEEFHISEPRINERIRVSEVRLVGPGGEQVGIVRVEDALRLAQEADLDLVEVAPDARPPVAKLMDYGKFKYEADMKAREARRNQANTVLKEIRFRLKIDPHDYGTKKGHVERFLSAGDKVKVMIMFRGREQSRPDAGIRLLQRLADDVAELGFVESAPKQDGRNMIMVLGPVRKKADARRAAQQAAGAKRGAKGESPTAEQPAAEPATATEPVEAAEPVKAVEPAKAVEPVKAATPAKAAEPEQPAEPKPAAKPSPAKPAPAKAAPAKATPAKATPAKVAAAKPAPKPAAAKKAATKPTPSKDPGTTES